jgi:hypothetical protein
LASSYNCNEHCKYQYDVIIGNDEALQNELISIYPINSKPFGLTYSEWSVKWWQWLLSLPKYISPAFDYTGEHAPIGQSDPNMFFLCQTFEAVSFIPIRKITIPVGRSILLPVINWVSIMGIDGQSDVELHSVATERMDIISNLSVKINGEEINENLGQFRVHSKEGLVNLPNDNILHAPPGRRSFVSDGYWLCFKSVSSILNISSFGSCSSGSTRIGITYDVKIS